MPSGKGRSKEDTWKESDLKKAIQGDKKERPSRREDDRRERKSDRDDDRKRRECREDLVNGEDKDRDKRRKERSSDKEKRRDKDRDGEKTRERSDRDKERRREKEGETSGRGRERKEGERSEKDKVSSRDRERLRERDRREREHGESEGRRRDRESDKDRERRHRSRRDHEGDDRRDERKLKEKEDETGSEERRKDRERRRRRDEGESSRHRDENRDQKREKSRERDHRDRRKEREHDESRKHRDKSGERREKKRERDDRERRKEKEEEIVSKHGPSRGERFRADTLEEANVVQEEDIKTRKSSIIKTEEDNDEDAFNYEEDFEDYEDDFENEQDDDDDLSLGERNAGMLELLNAINLENETVSREGTKMSRSSDDDSRKEPEVRPVTAKGRINFVAAKQKQISEKVASRTRKRGQELMHLIDLDVVVFEMFDLPPMNEYELYIKNFGRSDTKQAYVQCNDDNLEKEIQTEDIETRTMWTQNPAEDFAGCGDEKGSQEDTSNFSHATVDSVRLARFLQTAGQACLVLLEEESAEQSNKIVKDKKEMSCSDGYVPLATKQPYLAGRALECLHVSPVQNHHLLTAYGPVNDQETASSKMSDSMKAKSIFCLWNVNEPSTPQKILICESVPRCCCLSPSKATIAFAGLEDGSVVAWDLRESPSIHHSYDVDDGQVIFRSPTFSTAGVLSQDNHHSPVVSLLPVVMPGDSAKASTTLAGSLHSDDLLGLSFQLASLEQNAVINTWVVVELDIADIAGSESDLGLAPGGKIKLIKSSSLPLEADVRDVRKNAALQTYTMRFLPQDPNHFYIGTDSGNVIHRVRHGGRAPPKTFGPEIECLVDVTALDVSPWQLPCILAGNRDGSIRLYNLTNELPLNTWTHSTQGSSILSVQWSNSIPSMFFVLDANSTLYIWDLLKTDSEPVAIEKVKQGSVISFELSSDYSATGVGVPGRNAELTLGYKNGSVEVHKISAQFSKAAADELDRFHEYLEGVL
ncbi:WD repeat-containing protein 60-like isoform X2 [Actinia tenebrosa]|uniref:WD repeat-containing protein 60-like isoform X2 n=1 Tax=Actinia tenebrosa TaxID=6105 RepID=A0A6P8HP09_ACTTE|nr:WD repeat-containing protein 60-like isoform X2 [Actinia tenebrosa]